MAAEKELSREMYEIIARKREAFHKKDEDEDGETNQKDLLDILVTLRDEVLLYLYYIF